MSKTDRFANVLAYNTVPRMFSLDHCDVPFLDAEQWLKFYDNPVRFYLRADDEMADRIWAVLEGQP